MNIFNKVALQGMKKRPTRTLVTIVGVILSTIMITAVTTFALSLQDYMIRGAMMKYGSWQVGFLNASSSFIDKRVHEPQVENVSYFENIGYALLESGKNKDKPYLFIAGFNSETFSDIPLNLISGRLPENDSEILLPSHVASNGRVRYSIGDTLELSLGERLNEDLILDQYTPLTKDKSDNTLKKSFFPKTQRTFTVVGICERPSFEDSSAPGYTLITKVDTKKEDSTYSIFVTLKDAKKVHTYTGTFPENSRYILNDNVLRFMGISNDNIFNILIYSIGGILLILIMVGSVFLIYNSFNMSLNERTKEFGILSSVGATSTQLRNSVLFEGICIGSISIPIGIVLGIGSIHVVISIVARKFETILYSNVPLTLKLSIPAIIFAALVSITTILISAYLPAVKSSKTPVMDNIRQTNEIKVESKDIRTSTLTEKLYGIEGVFALKNFKRNKKGYRSIVFSLTLSIVLFVSASAFGNYLEMGAKQSVVTSDYHICFSSEDMDDDQLFNLYHKFKGVNGIYASSYQSILMYSCNVKSSDFSPNYPVPHEVLSPDETSKLSITMQFIPDEEFKTFLKELNLLESDYMGESPKMLGVAKFKEVSKKKNGKRELKNMFLKDSMNFTITPESIGANPSIESKEIPIAFADKIPVDTLPLNPSQKKPYVFIVVAPYSMEKDFNDSFVKNTKGLTFLSDNPSNSLDEIKKIIKVTGVTEEYDLYNVYEMLQQSRNIVFVVDIFKYVFIIMISLIAVSNVFNTISANMRLRRREFAMLRSVGMSPKSFKRMMNFECAFYGLRTLRLGLPLALLFSWLIYKGFLLGGACIDFVLPWKSIFISIFSVFSIVFVTILYSTKKISEENIIDSLRDDVT